ncbi:hypothetical protein BKA93DRAFT_823649 [Sparassis latifolia]|uniref:F-box domain-containing protein n=1 Tax=Sparassis crispa TaxID=139825 RepID=A0A401GD74_9APHY|nr:hypothetical protein SCP_0213200 [Sparassis crispa]GBE80117.1 hypothetical protein SCP_0213200 [Sparassis crispa]
MQGQVVHLQCGPCVRRDYETLATLARTSRVFHEPALDILWSYQADLSNLVKCFPSDSWIEIPGVDGAPTSLTFMRPLLPIDFTRFDQYAFRVRELCFKPFRKGVPVMYPSVELLRSLILYLPSRPLLPNLRAIVWDHGPIGNGAFPFCQLFLGANIKIMSWRSTNPASDLVVAYALLQQQQLSPCAHRISMELLSFPDILVKAPGVLNGFKELRSFSCISPAPLPYELFGHLAQLPRLYRLLLSSRGDDLVILPKDPAPPIAFPALMHLSVSAVSIKACAALLTATTFPSITNLRVTAYHTNTISPLLEAIQKQCSHVTLESLTISGLKPPGTAAPASTAPLACLHAFCSLRELTLDTLERPLALDDDALRGMALAWPQLGSLNLIGTRSRGAQTAVTLDALVTLVRHCPHLVTLQIPLSAAHTQMTPGRRPGGGYVNGNIQSLHLDASSAGDAAEVAAFLSDLFPNLRMIRPYVTGEPSLDWKLLEKLLPTFAAVRTQERTPLEDE